ncbi:F-actin-monooxygenase Mical-like isoform X3 [Artemia franciscana]|uniref:F-actin monooxygenase n=1 Tax=Artemia franciscana TaxID=6661 RepID=A0AA88HNX2_ARTSF|nr:hypothetical protein QYM36_010074 [Artemia franciscana]
MNNHLVSREEAALALDLFEEFINEQSFQLILQCHDRICELLKIRPSVFLDFYPALKKSLNNWKANTLWSKLDKRAQQKVYEGGRACSGKKVLIIGAGPCGLRSAIEAQLLGAKVVVIEKRNDFSRNNVLHIWPFVIKDLMHLGVKIFFGKFCVGSINHISIRQLQYVLLKVALCLGVEVHSGVSLEGLVPPDVDDPDAGWKACIQPEDHPVSQFEFDMIIGANGKRAVFDGFKRKEFRGKLAIAITANFVNNRSEQEACVEEISGVAFIFNQKFFNDMCEQTGIDLENIVYYKDDTHYFVMTAKKHSLLWRNVLHNDYPDTQTLLAPENINREALYEYALEAAMFATNYQLPEDIAFAYNHHGEPDVAMFDFTSMFASENACRIVERNGKQLLMALVGDGLLEPFWPTGSGCARGFLGCFDACYMLKRWASGEKTPLEVIAERESIYRLLAQTTSENLCKDLASYTLDPRTRYPNSNSRKVLPIHVRHLYDTDRPEKIETMMRKTASISKEEKENIRSLKALKNTESRLMSWFKLHLFDYPLADISDICTSFQTGQPLCALIHRYRPELLDYNSLDPEDYSGNCSLAFSVLEGMGIKPVIGGEDFASRGIEDKALWISYLQSVYLLFKGQIPYIHRKANATETADDGPESKTARKNRKSDASSLMKRVKRRRTEDAVHPKSKPKLTPKGKNKLGDSVFDKKQLEYLSRILLVKTGGAREESKENDDLYEDLTSEEIGKIDFNDMNLFLYRLESDFSDKQNQLEKMLFGGKENKDSKNWEIKKPVCSDGFTAKVAHLQQKFEANAPALESKKPKELVRAIGKLEESDWNIQRLKKKAEDPLLKADTESKVPKWNREQFHDKLHKIHNIAEGKKNDLRFTDLDKQMKMLDRKLKGESVLAAENRVFSARQKFSQPEDKATDTEPNRNFPGKTEKAKGSLPPAPTPRPADSCYICKKAVYLAERVCTEGKILHKNCLRCHYCNVGLRIGGYNFIRDLEFGGGFFYCSAHANQHVHRVLATPSDYSDGLPSKERLYSMNEEEPEKAAYEVLENSIMQLSGDELYDAIEGSDNDSIDDESDESDYQDFSDEEDQDEEEEETPHDSDQLLRSGEYDNVSSGANYENDGDSTDNDVDDEFSFYENNVQEPGEVSEEKFPPLPGKALKEHIYENARKEGLFHTHSGTNLSQLLKSRQNYIPVRNPEPPPLGPRLPEVRTKLQSSTSSISEMQKLLAPAIQPSPSMQTFLESADKLFTQSNSTEQYEDLYKRYAELPLQRSTSLVYQNGIGKYPSSLMKDIKVSSENFLTKTDEGTVSVINPILRQKIEGRELNSESSEDVPECVTNSVGLTSSPLISEENAAQVSVDKSHGDESAFKVVYDDIGLVNKTKDISEVKEKVLTELYDDIGNIQKETVDKSFISEKMELTPSSRNSNCDNDCNNSFEPYTSNPIGIALEPESSQVVYDDVASIQYRLDKLRRGSVDEELEKTLFDFENEEVEAFDEIEKQNENNQILYSGKDDNDIVSSPSLDVNRLSDSIKQFELEKVMYDDIGNVQEGFSDNLSNKYDYNLTLETSSQNEKPSVDTEDEFSEIFSEDVGNMEEVDSELQLNNDCNVNVSADNSLAKNDESLTKESTLASPGKADSLPKKSAFSPNIDDTLDFIDTSRIDDKDTKKEGVKEILGVAEMRKSYGDLRHSRERDSMVVKDLVLSAINKTSRRSQERLNAKVTPERVFPATNPPIKSGYSVINKVIPDSSHQSSFESVAETELPDTALTSQFKSDNAYLWAGVGETKNVRTLSSDDVSNESNTNYQKESLINKFASILGSPRKKPLVKSPVSPSKLPAAASPSKVLEKKKVPETLSDAEEMLVQVKDEADRLKLKEMVRIQEEEKKLEQKHAQLKQSLVKSLQEQNPGTSREETVGEQANLLGEMLATVEAHEKIKPGSETRKNTSVGRLLRNCFKWQSPSSCSGRSGSATS